MAASPASGFFRGRDEVRIGRNVKKRGASEFSLTSRFLFYCKAFMLPVSRQNGQYLVCQIQPECFMLFHVLDKAA